MYNRKQAVSYAQKWALSRNSEFADFEFMGGDCTNFISQCLYAGNIKFNYNNHGWYYHSLNNRAPSWSGVDELFSFATQNKSAEGPIFIISNITDMEIGDIIQLKVDNDWTHSLIITKLLSPKTTDNIFICAHTYDALNKQLSSYVYNEIRFLKVVNA